MSGGLGLAKVLVIYSVHFLEVANVGVGQQGVFEVANLFQLNIIKITILNRIQTH